MMIYLIMLNDYLWLRIYMSEKQKIINEVYFDRPVSGVNPEYYLKHGRKTKR